MEAKPKLRFESIYDEHLSLRASTMNRFLLAFVVCTVLTVGSYSFYWFGYVAVSALSSSGRIRRDPMSFRPFRLTAK